MKSSHFYSSGPIKWKREHAERKYCSSLPRLQSSRTRRGPRGGGVTSQNLSRNVCGAQGRPVAGAKFIPLPLQPRSAPASGLSAPGLSCPPDVVPSAPPHPPSSNPAALADSCPMRSPRNEALEEAAVFCPRRRLLVGAGGRGGNGITTFPVITPPAFSHLGRVAG